MVILKLSKPVPDEFECEKINTTNKEKYYVVRPCERYKELYQSCKSFRARLHQYYVYGELLDCSEHKVNYDSCLKYRKTGDLNSLEPIIQWEKKLIETRINTVKQNKAWKLRDTPPADFEKPLPEFIKRRQSESRFKN